MRTALIALALLAAGESATETLKQRDAEVRTALPPAGQAITPEARARLEKILTRAVDVRGMAEAALGPRWGKMTEKQRKRLLGAFEKRFRAVSGGELDGYRGTQFEYLPEEPVSDGVVRVPTRMQVKDEPVDVIYTMHREKEGWRIVDITIDGVSTVENYRASFARVIDKEGVEGLINRLSKGPTTGKS